MRGAENQAAPSLGFLVAAIAVAVFILCGLAYGLAELASAVAHAVRAAGGGHG